MPSSVINDVLTAMASTVNSVLGDTCKYTRSDGEVVAEVTQVSFDKNNKVTNDFGVLVGYNVLASVLISDVPEFKNGDLIIESDGTTWRVDMLSKETTAKWYFQVVRV